MAVFLVKLVVIDDYSCGRSAGKIPIQKKRGTTESIKMNEIPINFHGNSNH